MACPSEATVVDLVEARLANADRRALLVHLDECAACRRLVADVGVLADDGDDAIGRGALIGRYVVTRVIGAGAMGIVYAAHDPQLGRDVALKLVRGERAPDEMLREARTLARIAHPNVIAVHDADLHDDQVFIVMELVEGSTLREWLAAAPRSWPQLRDVFAQAARGLSAAHAAGLVHRDFKPDNVLIARDGRVRITDFGLAGTDAQRSGGTPAYMSPEQRAGMAVDARSDLYTFCVVLRDAAGAQVPRRARRVVERGLLEDRERRPHGMEATRHELERRPLATPVRVLAVAALLAMTVAASQLRSRTGERCDEADAMWGSVWTPARRAALGQYAAPTVAARVDASFADYRERWIATYHAACVAGGDVRRMRCLADRRAEAAELAAVVASDRKVYAADAVRALAPIADCDRTLPAPPAEPDLGNQLAVQSLLAARARASLDAHRYADCASSASAALATGVTWKPLEARLYYYRARCEDDDVQALLDFHTAAAAAEAGGDDETLAQAWIRLVYETGYTRLRWDEAERWATYARGAIDRLGGGDELEYALLRNRAVNANRRGDHDVALALEHDLEKLAVRIDGPTGAREAEVLGLFGDALSDEGRAGEALAYHERAIALQRPEDTGNIALLLNTGEDLMALGRPGEARGYDVRALAIAAETGTANDSWIRHRLASAIRALGEPAEALAEDRAARATCERFAANDSPACANEVLGEGLDLLALGRADEAVAPLELAIARFGSLAPVAPRFALARALATSDPPRARALARAARADEAAFVARWGGSRASLDEIERWLAR